MTIIRRQGRVIRRYGVDKPKGKFPDYSNSLRTKTRGCGLYALYSGKQLVYVGRATKSIRSRIYQHMKKGKIHFDSFSVFLVTGRSTTAQRQRIIDLEALVLNVIHPKPKYNKSITKFVGARKLPEHCD